MDDTLRSAVLGTAGLTLAGVAAVVLTVFRRPIAARRDQLSTVFALLVVLQAMHVVEEYATGFEDRFPQALGLPPWPASFFVVINVACLAVWCASVAGVRAGYRVAFFPAWFLALAGMANGIAHPLLALQAGAYFPGLVTSPLVGLGGIVLWKRLVAATDGTYTIRRGGP